MKYTMLNPDDYTPEEWAAIMQEEAKSQVRSDSHNISVHSVEFMQGPNGEVLRDANGNRILRGVHVQSDR